MATNISPICFIPFLIFLLFGALVQAIPTNNHGTDGSNIASRSIKVDLKTNPNYVPNGVAAYAHALKKWSSKTPGELAESLAAMGGSMFGELGATSVKGDREFLSSVGFGTPFQFLDVYLDTGSSDVWVYSSLTQAEDVGNHSTWVIAHSKTATPVENGTWIVQYSDGSAAYGKVFTDSINLGDVIIDKATIEAAISVSDEFISDEDIDGIFGLAYSLPNRASPQQPTVMSALLPLLSQPLFTIDLRHNSSNGAYTFGYIDGTRFLSDSGEHVHYTPLANGSTFWQFEFVSVHIGGTNDVHNDSFSAIADTGTSLMLLHSEVAKLYYDAVPGAQYNYTTSGGIWTYPCHTLPALPDFELGFANGFVVTVPGRYMNYSVFPYAEDTCVGGLQVIPDDDPQILGDVFLKSVYAVFDAGEAQIGFAKKDLD
ncbi:aspartic peptidase domain-containing protein [Achaetomium macrosporum]|uniref:Aspartic peptidase domain-containing protein n=1 Tax=Achaetomium macrosporum TaxID=79813 RepID=A0AAN7CBD6_9PEZI|nr:aspartic peptidase domain-containing protein [Achaetomium macrosporum]